MNVLTGLCIFVCAGLAAAGTLPHIESRIVGGEDANAAQFPYMASIRRDSGIFMCGAAIMRPRWILTAASCFEGLMHTDIFAVVGTHLLSTGGISHQISSIQIHPGYTPAPLANDIAIVQLDSPVIYTDFVQPIQPASIRFGGQLPAVVSGWGFTEQHATVVSDNLQTLSTTTITNEECSDQLNQVLPPNVICTVNPREDQGVCHLDNGGPLVIGNFLVGVTMGKMINCAVGLPDIFSRTSDHILWIESTISN